MIDEKELRENLGNRVVFSIDKTGKYGLKGAYFEGEILEFTPEMDFIKIKIPSYGEMWIETNEVWIESVIEEKVEE